MSDFAGLHSRKHDHEAQFYAFDILVSDGEDLRPQPTYLRKSALARLLRRRVEGIILNEFCSVHCLSGFTRGWRGA